MIWLRVAGRRMSSFLQSHSVNEFIIRKKQLEISPIHLQKQRVLSTVCVCVLRGVTQHC